MDDQVSPRRSWLRSSWIGTWLPLLLWMVIIFVLSAQPKLPSPPNSLLNLLLKKGAHMLEYAILMLLWWRALAGGDKKSARPNT